MSGKKHEDKTVDREKLISLKTALTEIDISTIDEIIESLTNMQPADIIDEISQCVLLSDYDAAVGHIDRYLTDI